MKKESNGIGENKNSKKINKNNKIISFILAIVMCCQPFVGANPNSDNREFVSDKGINNSPAADGFEEKDKEDKEEEDSRKSKGIFEKIKDNCFKLAVGALGIVGIICIFCRKDKKQMENQNYELEEENLEEKNNRKALVGSIKVKVDGEERIYEVCNVGKLGEDNRFEHLSDSGKFRFYVDGSGEHLIKEFPVQVFFNPPDNVNVDNGKINDTKHMENILEQLKSEYSKFIYKNIYKNCDYENCKVTYKVLYNEKSDFRLVNFCVYIVVRCPEPFGYSFSPKHFLVPLELVKVLIKNGYSLTCNSKISYS
ncbi:MAG: hypothetical protein CfP315_0685 [Candidatus Improbicoccus pseudotrichonymphae]|uniref:Uncharacterized protein n=1 Tax=Candidatus Improbicoccus pseudotrichonymphae TaxID=3033792 RepID=A0AA48HVC8_9FIRM|nr:MAG: hypothetical protein CfP315_0685 [Candidatus Improbicoccus pseudotrichonymphae]